MKLTYTTSDGRLTVELEASNDKDMFRKLAHFQEIFEDSPSANILGQMQSGGNVSYRVRKASYVDEKGKQKEAEYFEKLVTSGPLKWFKKNYGVLDDGSENLFPKRPSDDEANIVRGENGWYKYNKQQ